MHKTKSGFTIVEIIIVIVVIGILAAITIVAYNGIQQRSRDTQRKSDIAQVAKVLELYYTINGKYPSAASAGSTLNSGWAQTGDGSWDYLVNLLQPYGSIPIRDPVNTANMSVLNSSSVGYGYAYFGDYGTTDYCANGELQTYLLAYRFEGLSQANNLQGTCGSPAVGPYSGASNWRVAK